MKIVKFMPDKLINVSKETLFKFDTLKLNDLSVHLWYNSRYAKSFLDILAKGLHPNRNSASINGVLLFKSHHEVVKEIQNMGYYSTNSRRIYKVITYCARTRLIMVIKTTDSGHYKLLMNPRYYFKGNYLNSYLVWLFGETEWFEKRNIEVEEDEY